MNDLFLSIAATIVTLIYIIAMLNIGSDTSKVIPWELRYLLGFTVQGENVADALSDAAQFGRLLQITYRDASGAFHTRTVELWQYDAKHGIFRTREVSTKHYRQVIVSYITSVRWVGKYSTVKSEELRYDADALAALAMLSTYAPIAIH